MGMRAWPNPSSAALCACQASSLYSKCCTVISSGLPTPFFFLALPSLLFFLLLSLRFTLFPSPSLWLSLSALRLQLFISSFRNLLHASPPPPLLLFEPTPMRHKPKLPRLLCCPFLRAAYASDDVAALPCCMPQKPLIKLVQMPQMRIKCAT